MLLCSAAMTDDKATLELGFVFIWTMQACLIRDFDPYEL